MTHDVFISYSSKDKHVTDYICANIEGAGIRCWIAPRDISPGEDWPTAIANAIPQCRVMVLVFTANSNESKDVGNEIHLVANNNLVIIPFKIENVQPEPGKKYYLARTHWLDAVNPPTQKQINFLISRVKALLTVPETPPVQKSQHVTAANATPHVVRIKPLVTITADKRKAKKVVKADKKVLPADSQQAKRKNKSASLEPMDANAYIKHGDTHFQKKHYRSALADFTQAIELNPRKSLAYFHRCDTFYELNDYSAALVDVNRALKLNPNYLSTESKHSRDYYDLRDSLKKLIDQTKAIELDLKFTKNYINRGLTYTRLRDYSAALADYTRAIELNPKDAVTYNYRGLTYANLKNYPAALADYTQAIKIVPKFGNAIYNMACCYALQGKDELACQWLYKAIKLDREYLHLVCIDADFKTIKDSEELKVLLSKYGRDWKIGD
jgi:tetratricopeptide (TPR) repeat protein